MITETQPALLPLEKIESIDDVEQSRISSSDSEIDARYVSGEVRIVVEQARYPLKQIPEIVSSSDYNMQPNFQRRLRWAREKQSRLIESLIMNVPIPPVFLYEKDLGRYEVMDGRQRLTAINDYYGNAFSLEGLREWPELNNRRYSELPEQIRRGIDRRFLSAIILLHETAKSSDQAERLKQLVFERINSGGEDLSAQEKRNALFPGPMNTLCIELARNEHLCRLWGIPEPSSEEINNRDNWTPEEDLASNDLYKTMGDAELVLRFFAHRQRKSLWRSGSRLDDYFTSYLKRANQFPGAVLNELKSIFVNTIELASKILGERAFWLVRDRRGERVWIERPAMTAYDPIMAALSRLLGEANALQANSAKIRSEIEKFYGENYSDFDGRKTNASDIKRRDDLFFEFFNKFAN